MSVSTPQSEASDGSRPSLSPLSDASIASAGQATIAAKTGTEIVEEAFGGRRHFWPGGRQWPGVSCYQAALKRLTRSVPHGSNPSQCLRCWGFKKNEATLDLFWLAENFEDYFEGRIIIHNIATKWILNVASKHAARQVPGEELNKTNNTGEFQGVSLRYLPVVEDKPGELFAKKELEFAAHIAQSMEEWLKSRPVPKGHTRFFHGTSTHDMNNIVENGINVARFQPIGDFGSGFYCADKVRTSIRFAMITALSRGFGRQSACLMYFDVKNGDLSHLKQIQLDGEEWMDWTRKCLSNKEETVYRGEDRSSLQLVIGKLVHNPHQVEYEGLSPEAFEDNRLQYCFREKAANLLFKDRTKMGVALFDVYLPQEEEPLAEEGNMGASGRNGE